MCRDIIVRPAALQAQQRLIISAQAMSAHRSSVLQYNWKPNQLPRCRQDLDPYKLGREEMQWGPERKELLAVWRKCGSTAKLEGGYQVYKGFFLGGSKVPVGSFLEIIDNRKNRINCGAFQGISGPCLVQLSALRQFYVAGQFAPCVWARVQLFLCDGDDLHLHCPVFHEVARVDWFSLADRSVQILARAHVLPHPTQEGTVVLNTWLKRKHSASL